MTNIPPIFLEVHDNFNSWHIFSGADQVVECFGNQTFSMRFDTVFFITLGYLAISVNILLQERDFVAYQFKRSSGHGKNDIVCLDENLICSILQECQPIFIGFIFQGLYAGQLMFQKNSSSILVGSNSFVFI